jgi:hypothetical protein
MGLNFEVIIVGVAVVVALAWAGRAAWRSVRKQGVCSSCGSSGECPVAGNPKALDELGRKGMLNQPTNCQELADGLEKEPYPESLNTPSK